MTKAIIGNIKKTKKNLISKTIKQINKNKSAKMNKLLIAIPIKMENPTKPCLYSFFQGLKKVLIIKVSEKTSKNALFKDAKKRRIFKGASKYQNFKKMKGNEIIPCIGSILSLGY